MKNGAIYIRVSTDRQEELSPDAQRRLILDYAKKNDIIISEDYIYTEAISGRHADKRPQFQRMIATAKAEDHPIDVILVWKFSRFARNQEESIVYKSLLKKQCNVDVVSISEPLIDGPFGSLIERIIEWMDEYYSIRLSGEVMRGMTEKALRGGYQAKPPLGYRYNGPGTVPTIAEPEADTIRYIFHQYADAGVDRTTIARRLNDMGRRTLRGNLFEKRNIEYILRNPFYIGKIRWNRAPHSSDRENPEDQIIVSDGAHSPIVAPETFERAKSRLASERRQNKARSVSACRHWLSGIVHCAVCGASLSYSQSAGGFQCWRYGKGFHKESCYISEKKLVKAVLDGIREFIDGKDFDYDYIPPKAPASAGRIELLRDELRRIDVREDRIRAAYENGIDTLEEYGANKRRLQADREHIVEEIEKELEKEKSRPVPSKDEVLGRMRTIYDVLADDSVDHISKGNCLRELFSEIIYDRQKDALTFRITVS